MGEGKKVERGGIGYVRQNFWPLRDFLDLPRREPPRRVSGSIRLPIGAYTAKRESVPSIVSSPTPSSMFAGHYTGLSRHRRGAGPQRYARLQFDGNRYCVPHRFAGRRLTLKADSSSVTIYDRVQEIVSYARSWRRGQTFGAERFEAELAEFRPAARRSRAQDRLFAFLDGLCSKAALEAYLRDIADSDRSLSRQITELLELIPASTVPTPWPAPSTRPPPLALSAPTMSPTFCGSSSLHAANSRPLRLRDPRLNELVTDPLLSLLAYDAFILESEKESDDTPGTETPRSESDGHEPPSGRRPSLRQCRQESQCGGDSGMACRHGNGSESRPRHRAPFQILEITGTAQHRRVSLLSPQEPLTQNKNRVLRLLDLSFFANGTNLILIGNPGVGKTFLSKIVGWRACQSNQRVLFTTAMDMLNHLLASQVDHSLVRKLKAYTEPRTAHL